MKISNPKFNFTSGVKIKKTKSQVQLHFRGEKNENLESQIQFDFSVENFKIQNPRSNFTLMLKHEKKQSPKSNITLGVKNENLESQIQLHFRGWK